MASRIVLPPNVCLSPPARKDTGVARAMLGQRWRIERRVRVRRVLLICTCLVNVVRLALTLRVGTSWAIGCIASEAIVGGRRIVKVAVNRDGLLDFIDPRCVVVSLRWHSLAPHVLCEMAVHVRTLST